MEYVHAALLLHSAEKEITEESVTSVINATGEKADGARVKALVAALDGVNIDEAVEKAVAAPAVAAAPAASGDAPAEEKKEEAEDEKSDEDAAEGLGSLFG